jgi:hypothetical protein
MRMVQVIIHEIVDVVTMRDGLMPAAGAVGVAGFVLAAGMSGSAGGGIRGVHVQVVLLHAITLLVVQVALVKVVRVAVMGDGGMTAPRTMMVRVSLMGLLLLVGSHLTAPCTMS